MGKLHVTGLTGGMGSGKSSAARFLCRRFAISCFSADRVVHELLEPQQSCWRVVRELGAFLNEDQTLNKPLFREALFADNELREQVNNKMHPLVHQALFEKIHHANREFGQYHFLIDVPLLYEAEWRNMFATVIVVYAAPEKCIERVVARDGVPREQAERSICSQWPLREKALRADHVVDNSGLWSDSCIQLLHLGEFLWGKGKLELQKV
ncbi:MAG: dephospho-CoA kinase [Pseudomonadota bacterium]